MEIRDSKFARDMMAQKLMSENKDNPFNSRFFQPSDAYSKQQTRPIQGDLTLGNLASYFMPFSKDVGPYEDSPKLGRPGGVNIDFPPIAKDAVSGINKFGQVFRGELSQDEIKQLAFDTSMNVTGGSLVGSKLLKNAMPKDALAMGLTTKANKQLDNAGEVAKVVPPTDKTDGIFAFHGSAANFDKFKLSKIGTGEGHQAFGYGLYFTDSKDIAKFYKDALSKEVNVGGKPFIRGSKHYPEILKNETLSDNLSSTNGDLEKAIKYIEETVNEMKELKNVNGIKSYTQELKDLKALRGKVEVRQNTGKTYEVNIKTVTDDLLDYDKPLSEQPKIFAKLEKHYGARDLSVLGLKNKGKDSEELTGREFYSLLQNKFGKDSMDKVVKINKKLSELNKVIDANSVGYRNFTSPEGKKAAKEYDKLLLERAKIPKYRFDDKSSEFLNSLGIKGIKYEPGQLTPGGQYKTKGESNFVIFDDKIIDVMAKYGIVGAIGVSAMQAEGGGDILPPGAI